MLGGGCQDGGHGHSGHGYGGHGHGHGGRGGLVIKILKISTQSMR